MIGGIIDVLRALIRIFAASFVVAGVGLLALLGTLILSETGAVQQTLGRVWFEHHVASLNLSQAVIQRRIAPQLWDPTIVTALGWPSWIALPVFAGALFLFGVILFAITRRHRAV